jgi:hypothetical protein
MQLICIFRGLEAKDVSRVSYGTQNGLSGRSPPIPPPRPLDQQLDKLWPLSTWQAPHTINNNSISPYACSNTFWMPHCGPWVVFCITQSKWACLYIFWMCQQIRNCTFRNVGDMWKLLRKEFHFKPTQYKRFWTIWLIENWNRKGAQTLAWYRLSDSASDAMFTDTTDWNKQIFTTCKTDIPQGHKSISKYLHDTEVSTPVSLGSQMFESGSEEQLSYRTRLDRVVSVPALYSGGLGYESVPGHRLSCYFGLSSWYFTSVPPEGYWTVP